MNQIDRRLAQWNPVRTEDLTDAKDGPEAIALLRRVLAEPPEARPELPWRHRRVFLRRMASAGALAAAVTGAVVMAVVLWPSGAPMTPPGVARTHGNGPVNVRLVDFAMQADEIVARITDPDAAAGELTAVFQAHGLDIHVEALPVSPSLVGSIVYDDVPSIRSLQAGECLGGGTSCVVGLVIPADFTGEANVTVGRAADPGQPYESSASVFGPGEVLHCSGVLGQPIADALPVLQAKGLEAWWGSGDNRTPPTSGYVVDGIALSSSSVLLDTSPQPLDTPEFHHYEEAANRGC